MKNSRFQQRIAPMAIGLALAMGPSVSWPVSLGELKVVSGVEQPLRAEIPLDTTPEEFAGISAHLASPEIFRQLGVEYRPGFKDLVFSVERRGEQHYVLIRSSRPIPDADMRLLLQLDWPAGRLIDEYTLHGAFLKAATAQPTAADAVPLVAAAEAQPAPAPARVIESGETLGGIAEETRYGQVSFEQMLLGLFNTNPDAFVGRNINRLKTGAILNVPEEAFVAAIPAGEAKEFYLSHVGNWNGYRRSLAASSERMRPADEGANQESSGKIGSQAHAVVSEPRRPRDQVKVGVAHPNAKDRASAKAAAVADWVAQEKALKDARERLAALEKNVEELQRLLDVKNADMARLQSSDGDSAWGKLSRWASENPVALIVSGGLIALVLLVFWFFARRKTPAQERSKPFASEPYTESAGDNSGGAAPQPLVSDAAFDMRTINLDLATRPSDDGEPPWSNHSQNEPAGMNVPLPAPSLARGQVSANDV